MSCYFFPSGMDGDVSVGEGSVWFWNSGILGRCDFETASKPCFMVKKAYLVFFWRQIVRNFI